MGGITRRPGIAGWAIGHPVSVVMITLAVLVVGMFALKGLTVDLLPQIIYPEVRVRILDPGVPATIMEDQVTRQLEEQLAITEDAIHVQSRTSEGRSSVDLSFEYGKDIDIALRDASTRLDRAKRFLPETIDPPVIYKRDPFQLPVAEFVVSSSLRDPVELRAWADYSLSRYLLNLPGVAAAEVGGGRLREIQVEADQDRLAGLGLDVLDIADALEQGNRDTPAGRLMMDRGELAGRTGGRFVEVADIVGLPIIVGLLALRVEQRLKKVERASEALAVGEFSARVDDQGGPSDELATTFNQMAQRIEDLIRSREELVQAVSHELGSPLSRLRFHLELMENRPEGKREGRIEAMSHELDALDELVAELLSYVQTDELELERHAFDPTQGLTDLAELARLEAHGDRAVDVELELANDVQLVADRRLFQRAVENVLRNAVQHARGKVLLELSLDEHNVRVAVHDDGPGIPEELRDEVMIPFVRLDADRSRTTGGVGLGLAIVCRIMNRHNGRFEIGTSPLGGATVATLWPRGD